MNLSGKKDVNNEVPVLGASEGEVTSELLHNHVDVVAPLAGVPGSNSFLSSGDKVINRKSLFQFPAIVADAHEKERFLFVGNHRQVEKNLILLGYALVETVTVDVSQNVVEHDVKKCPLAVD